jgi:Heterokaryon incompatibility protein (HET)
MAQPEPAQPSFERPNFKYQHLDTVSQEIRLIKASSPGHGVNGDGEISLAMSTVALKNPPPFIALSYAWGNPQFIHPITCNGQRLFLTPNLARALRTIFASVRTNSTTIYRKGEDISLWVDSICINQDDNVEKSSQISLMRDIYTKAKAVLAYIGAPEHGDPKEGVYAYVLSEGMSVLRPNESGTWEVPPLNWEAFKQLLGQPFFGRSWIFQEMVLASQVLCLYGDEVKWASWDLEEIMSIRTLAGNSIHRQRYIEEVAPLPLSGPIGPHFRQLQTNALNMESWRYLRQRMLESPDGIHPIIALSDVRRAEVSDQRDKIYSVLGLFTKDYREALTVDYSPSNSTAKTFIDFAEFCIRHNLGILLLEQAGISQQTPDIPSWVPDWSFEPRYMPQSRYKGFHCSGSTEARITLSKEPRKIHASGWIIGDVRMLRFPCSYGDTVSIPSCPQVKTFSQAVFVLETLANEWCDMLAEHGCFGEEDFSDVVWRTLWLDTNWYGERSIPGDRKYYEAWLAEHPRPSGLSNVTLPVGRDHGEAGMFVMAALHMQGRVLGLMSGAFGPHIGVLPNDAACGDRIALLLGGRTPFVLRPVAGTREYELVGACYVHGIMDGELLEKSGDDPRVLGKVCKELVIR